MNNARVRRIWFRWTAVIGGMLLPAIMLTAASGEPTTDAGKGFLGVLLAQQELSLAPLVGGQLLAIHVRIGDRVSKNFVVAELDEQPIRREREEADGRLEEAQAAETEATTRLTMADETLQKQRALSAAGVTSTEQLRAAEKEKELAQSSLDRARARVQQQVALMKQLDAKLAQTRLVAPFSGRVAARHADPGMTVGPSIPVVSLIGDAALWARFAVPVESTRDLTIGGEVEVLVSNVGVTMKGTIQQVGSTVDEASGMVFYEAVVEPSSDWSGPPLVGQTIRVFPAARGQ